jgi:hypothetical protein
MRHRAPWIFSTVSVVFLVTGLTAQQSTTATTSRGTRPKSTSVTVKGCVAEASGHYLLNRATLVAPAPAVAAPAAPIATSGQSDDQVYELVGRDVKAHVGHEVEVTGTQVRPEDTAGGGKPDDVKQSAHPMTGTVNVKSVKPLSGTCP